MHTPNVVFLCESEAVVKTQATVQLLRNICQKSFYCVFRAVGLANVYIVNLSAAESGFDKLCLREKTIRHRNGNAEKMAVRLFAVSHHRRR